MYPWVKILCIYFLDRGEGREKEEERNINMWLPLTGDLACQHRHVSWLGIEPATLWLAGGTQSTETPARARFKKKFSESCLNHLLLNISVALLQTFLKLLNLVFLFSFIYHKILYTFKKFTLEITYILYYLFLLLECKHYEAFYLLCSLMCPWHKVNT